MIKTYTITKILDIRIPDIKAIYNYGKFKNIRNAYKLSMQEFENCICCDKKFENSEDVYMAHVKNEGNKLCCFKCFEENKMDVSEIYK